MQEFLDDLDHAELKGVDSFRELLPVVLRVISRMPRPLVQISGPVTTGGRGSMDENLRFIEKAARVLKERGYVVFDYVAFQQHLERIKNTKYPTDVYCSDMLDIFFRGVFESGHIATLFFLPDWQSSTGARWERDVAQKCGIEIVDMPNEWLD